MKCMPVSWMLLCRLICSYNIWKAVKILDITAMLLVTLNCIFLSSVLWLLGKTKVFLMVGPSQGSLVD